MAKIGATPKRKVLPKVADRHAMEFLARNRPLQPYPLRVNTAGIFTIRLADQARAGIIAKRPAAGAAPFTARLVTLLDRFLFF